MPVPAATLLIKFIGSYRDAGLQVVRQLLLLRSGHSQDFPQRDEGPRPQARAKIDRIRKLGCAYDEGPEITPTQYTTRKRYPVSAAERMIDSSFFRVCGCPSTINVSPAANSTFEPGLNSRWPDRRLTPTTISP